MISKTLTDGAGETLVARYVPDNNTFALAHQNRNRDGTPIQVIILNEREVKEFYEFIGEHNKSVQRPY